MNLTVSPPTRYEYDRIVGLLTMEHITEMIMINAALEQYGVGDRDGHPAPKAAPEPS